MKQLIAMKVAITLDYDHPGLLAMLKNKMVEEGKTADQIRAEVHNEFIEGLKKLIDADLKSPFPGLTYVMEDVSNEKH